MNAKDEILRKLETMRRLLDERGVEHYDRFDVTEWVGADGEICHTSVTYSNGAAVLVLRKCTTPEQAITATLGSGTCRLKRANWDDGTCTWGCICSACDAHLEHETGIGYNYCPICGAKVVGA